MIELKFLPFKPPEGFPFKRYNRCLEMDFDAWASALEIRGYINDRFSEGAFHRDREGEEFFWAVFQEAIDSLPPENTGEPAKRKALIPTKTVTSVTVSYLAATWSGVREVPDVSPYEQCLLEMSDPKDEGLHQEFERISGMSIDLLPRKKGREFLYYSNGKILVNVDIDAPEETLIKDFKNFIHEFKNQLEFEHIEKEYGRKNLIEWCQKKVLLYMDLNFLAKFHKKKITQHVMGAILYPDSPVNVAEKVRSGVKRLAEELFASEAVAALRKQTGAGP